MAEDVLSVVVGSSGHCVLSCLKIFVARAGMRAQRSQSATQ